MKAKNVQQYIYFNINFKITKCRYLMLRLLMVFLVNIISRINEKND